MKRLTIIAALLVCAAPTMAEEQRGCKEHAPLTDAQMADHMHMVTQRAALYLARHGMTFDEFAKRYNEPPDSLIAFASTFDLCGGTVEGAIAMLHNFAVHGGEQAWGAEDK
jgi:hypothetical protein